MDTIRNTLYLLDNYNALIKYHIKVDREGLSGERKINFNFDVIPDLNAFGNEIKLILQKNEYSQDFVYQINRLFLVCESNSDLFAIHGNVEKKMYKDYPFACTLESLSFGIYEFIRDEIIETDKVLPNFDNYPVSIMTESNYKNDESILWLAYYLLQNITNAFLEQEKKDLEHQLSFKSEADINKFIQQQKEIRVEEIISLSNGLCDKNLPFLYIGNSPFINQDNLFYLLLSEILERISSEEYAKYIQLDYLKYQPKKYHWNFASTSLDSFDELQELFGFNKLVRILSNSLFVKEHTEITEGFTIETVEPIENLDELDDYLDKREKELETKIEPKTKKAEYIISIPILDLIYQEFDDELWDNITLMEFLEMFTSEVNKQENFKLKPKQTTRFYYLLKKIWINSSGKTLFETEKEWAIAFLQNYNLSYSAYTNQFIRNEGGLKHRQFIKSVDKILPKNEIV